MRGHLLLGGFADLGQVLTHEGNRAHEYLWVDGSDAGVESALAELVGEQALDLSRNVAD